MKKTHKQKVKLATKMNKGIRKGCFDSNKWIKRREQILKKVLKKQKEAHQRALERKKKI